MLDLYLTMPRGEVYECVIPRSTEPAGDHDGCQGKRQGGPGPELAPADHPIRATLERSR